ncbi:TonB-dependent receptor plug domain-containing protein [Sandarakinorhabdus rubra]|uniref:TonB-dependent receptor plug domain-containing protein n=1 Tax=Sandarakinorhabdus rubra TaxID=2672568 RepID=UPI001F41F953|nr:TonB-dependent receptor [Sandarakinorhabdus rubra]
MSGLFANTMARRVAVLASSALVALAWANAASAQAAGNQASADDPEVEEIVVTGSQIRGAKDTGATPLSIVGTEQIQAVAAVSGADLFRSIPSLGGVTFNEQVLGGGSPNAARGDVSTISLRGLGNGNTLVLINGRRSVLHPTSQAITGVIDSGVPTFGYNANTVPVGAISRVEILRDGAAALYGSDAVAGVVNNVLNDSYKGLKIDLQYGGAEGTSLREFTANVLAGADFAGGRGHITLFGGYARKTKLLLADQDYTAFLDRRPFVAGTSFANVAAFNGTSTSTPWGTFRAQGSGIITTNGTPLTNASRQFHVQPNTNTGCRVGSTTPGVCYDDGVGTTEMAGVDSNLRFDNVASFPGLTTQPSVDRVNLFAFANYELTDNLEFFGEAGFYHGKTDALVTSGGSLANIPITVAANAYWNPLGAVGSPNRLAGLNIPDAGLPVTISALNYVDAGPRRVEVTNQQYRLLGGLKGEFGNWHWESAVLYSWATARDVADGLSNTALQAAINRTTSDAYNPFNGGCLTTPGIGDCTTNSQATIDSFRIKAVRATKTTLALWDLRVSNNELLGLWAGNKIGIAAGIEYREETFRDNRDARQGGVAGRDTTYTDSVTGIFYGSDLVGASPSPDVFGKRNVKSAYLELAIPLVNPDMNVPLIRSLDVQAAGRYEDYSDVGSVAKPKASAAWEVFNGLTVRGSWGQGFRAPNLEVINTSALDRVNNGVEYTLCEADLRAGRIANFSQCNRNISVLRRSGGNPNLKPEESESWNIGVIVAPPLPDGWGQLNITVDRWRIAQKNVVGLLDFQNQLNLDYLRRVNGATNTNAVRATPTADDIAAVAGTGLAPVGELQFVLANFENLQPITVEGIDINVDYRIQTAVLGTLGLNLNATKLIRYEVAAPPPVQELIDAQAAGTINAGVPITGGGDFVGIDGQPEWRLTGNFTWTLGPVTFGTFVQYIDRIVQNGVRDAQANPFPVGGQTTTNMFLTYRFETDNALNGTAITVGARNIDNMAPPLASTGYFSALYAPQRRYWYVNVAKSF